MSINKIVLAVALVGAVAPAARADTPPDAAAEDPAPPTTGAAADATATAAAAKPAGGPQVVLPRGRWLIDAQLEIDLSSGAAFKPVSLSPDVWYGATDKLTIGLVHSSLGATGIMGGVGDSLCLTGSSNGCPNFYNDVGLDGRYSMGTGPFAWALDGGLYILDTSPFQFAIKLGMLGRYESGKVAVEFEPSLFLGLTNRSPTTTVMGVMVPGPQNTETLSVPVTLLYTVAPKVALVGQLGLVLPFSNTGDSYRVPFSIGAQYRVDEHIHLNAAFSLPELIGGGDDGVDARVLSLGGGYAF